MIKIILIMAAGIGVGALLRGRNLRHLGRLISVLIWLLLFLLGVEVGGDERIVRGIGSLGLEAAAISLAGVIGCGLLSMGLWRYASRKDLQRKEEREKRQEGGQI